MTGERSGAVATTVPATPPVVHLELHTGDRDAAGTFYAQLLQWQLEEIVHARGRYHALHLGGPIGGGVVECATERPLWLPYVEVARIDRVTARARALGATVLLEPREGPAGWRSVIGTRAGAQLALWQGKEWR